MYMCYIPDRLKAQETDYTASLEYAIPKLFISKVHPHTNKNKLRQNEVMRPCHRLTLTSVMLATLNL